MCFMAIAMVGCTTLRPLDLDSSGRFSTSTAASPSDVQTRKPFLSGYRRMLYVKFDENEAENAEITEFFLESFGNMRIFEKIVQKQDMEQIVVANDLTNKVTNVSDFVGLSVIRKSVGPFLVVEPRVRWDEGRHKYLASLRATDPDTAAAVFYFEKYAIDLAGLDKPLLYPMLNAFLDWASPADM